MRHGSKTAAVVALAAALLPADASQAWAWGYGAALGQDGMTLDRLVSEVLKPIVQLAGYVPTAFWAYRYFQNRSDDGPAARQALGMLATEGVMVAFTAYDLGRGSLNGFMREFAVPGLIAPRHPLMINGFYDYFFHFGRRSGREEGLAGRRVGRRHGAYGRGFRNHLVGVLGSEADMGEWVTLADGSKLFCPYPLEQRPLREEESEEPNSQSWHVALCARQRPGVHRGAQVLYGQDRYGNRSGC